MARARNIKPGIMENEDLAELPFPDRLFFIYLWMLADREGRIEDRPRRIKAQAFPYDEFDADEALDRLQNAGFIVRYEAAGVRAIQVLSFAKHQTPHVREQASALPEFDEALPRQCLGENKHQPRQEQAIAKIAGFSDSLIVDSLIPDNCSLRSQSAQDAPLLDALPADDAPQRKTSGTPKRAVQLPESFEPDDTAKALASELGVSLAVELPKFRDYHAARGKPMKDWQAALRTWLRNARQFVGSAAPRARVAPVADNFAGRDYGNGGLI